MDFIELKTGNDDIDRRLDKVIRRFLANESLSSLYKLLRKGLVKVNKKKVDGSYHIQSGDTINIAAFLLQQNTESAEVLPKAQQLNKDWIILKNDYLLILNKPYDIPVQKSSENQISLDTMVADEYIKSHTQNTSLSFKTGPLHRLDKKTTGVLVFSQNLIGARWFSKSIAEHTTSKIYIGLAQGKLKNKEEWIDLIEKNSEETAFKTVKAGGDTGKQAVTEVTPIAYGKYNETPVTLIKYNIKTGRTHQIRSQTSLHGFPLFGDTAYGGTKIQNNTTGQDFFLHALYLIFPEDNPCDIKQKITAPLPTAFAKILEQSLIKDLDMLIL